MDYKLLYIQNIIFFPRVFNFSSESHELIRLKDLTHQISQKIHRNS